MQTSIRLFKDTRKTYLKKEIKKMAKNFDNVDKTESVYNDMRTATGSIPAAEEATEPKKKQPAKKNTKASKTQKTQATQKTRSTRKTQERKQEKERPTERMNLSLTPSNLEYIQIMSGIYELDKCKFVNMVLEEHAAQNEKIYKDILKLKGSLTK